MTRGGKRARAGRKPGKFSQAVLKIAATVEEKAAIEAALTTRERTEALLRAKMSKNFKNLFT